MSGHQKPDMHGRDHRWPGYYGTDDPGGEDPILPPKALLSGGPGLLDTILALGADAVWKLDETTGNVAHDSSGNGYDMTAPGGGQLPPTWGQPAGPPGTLSGGFSEVATRVVTTAIHAPASGDFSAGVWLRRADDTSSFIIGGGAPVGSFSGWALGIEAYNQGAGNHPILFVGAGGSTRDDIEGDNPTVTDGSLFYLLGVSRISGVWYLFVNGLQQHDTIATVMSGGTSDVWLGRDDTGGPNGARGDATWAFFFGSRALTGSEWLDIMDALSAEIAADSVVVSDGSGSTTFKQLTAGTGITIDTTSDPLRIQIKEKVPVTAVWSGAVPSVAGVGTEIRIPKVNGDAVTFNLLSLFSRLSAAPSGAVQFRAEKSVSGGVFSAVSLGTTTHAAGDHEKTSALSSTISSGDLLRLNYIDVSGGQGGSYEVELTGSIQ